MKAAAFVLLLALCARPAGCTLEVVLKWTANTASATEFAAAAMTNSTVLSTALQQSLVVAFRAAGVNLSTADLANLVQLSGLQVQLVTLNTTAPTTAPRTTSAPALRTTATPPPQTNTSQTDDSAAAPAATVAIVAVAVVGLGGGAALWWWFYRKKAADLPVLPVKLVGAGTKRARV